MKDNKFIVVVPVYNAEKYIEKSINSIINQDYKNFEVVVVDDCSTDNTFKLLKEFKKIQLIRNTERKRCVISSFITAIDLCANDDEDIIMNVDGDDSLSDNNVLSYLNEVYQDENICLTYGQFEPLSKSYSNYCKPIPDINTYRRCGIWVTSSPRTLKKKLFDRIDKKDLLNSSGEYYKTASDLAYMYPAIEMAGPKRIKFINKVLYVYNDLNPINDMKVNLTEQLTAAKEIQQKPLYKELENI